jgi:hypothetical protein
VSAITVGFYKEFEDVLYFAMPERWSWQDFWEAKQRTDRVLDTLTHPVAVLFLTHDHVHLPEGAISEARMMLTSKHPLTDTAVVVSQNALIHNTVRMIGVLFARYARIYARNSAEEAEEFLRSRGFLSIPLPSSHAHPQPE